MHYSLIFVIVVLFGIYLAAVCIPLILIKFGVIGGADGLFLRDMGKETTEKVRYILKDMLYSSFLIILILGILWHAYVTLPLWLFLACLIWIGISYMFIMM